MFGMRVASIFMQTVKPGRGGLVIMKEWVKVIPRKDLRDSTGTNIMRIAKISL